jgi:hypothetical protein
MQEDSMTTRAFALCAALVVLIRTSTMGQDAIFPIAHEPISAGRAIVSDLPPTPDTKREAMVAPHLQVMPEWCATAPANPYTAGSTCLQLLGGGHTTIPGFGPRVSDFSYASVSLRHGWMLTTPDADDGPLRGNWEILCDLTGAALTSGIGHWFAGPRVQLRYNFVQPEASLVPYVQIGTGFMFTDTHLDKQQRGIGQFVECYSCVGSGVRCFLSDNWTLDLEASYQHMSNARMSSRNYGINPVGGQIGFTYFFPAGH